MKSIFIILSFLLCSCANRQNGLALKVFETPHFNWLLVAEPKDETLELPLDGVNPLFESYGKSGAVSTLTITSPERKPWKRQRH